MESMTRACVAAAACVLCAEGAAHAAVEGVLDLASPALLEESSARPAFNEPVSLTVGAARSSDTDGGLRVALKVGHDTSSLEGLEIFRAGAAKPDDTRSWWLHLSPVVDFETNEGDGFNHVILKMTGEFMSFPLDPPSDDTESPDPSATGLWHVVPISAGIEADDQFRFVNALAEIGYVPWYRRGTYPPESGQFELGFNPFVGVFLQAGRKFDIDDTPRTGGAEDESSEGRDETLFRVKLRVEGDLPLIEDRSTKTIWLTLRPQATVWYDFANGDWYHQVSVVSEVRIQDGRSLELRYDNGSGAPNFNTGSQFAAGLKITF